MGTPCVPPPPHAVVERLLPPCRHFSADVPPTEEMLDRLLASRTLFAATELRTQLTYSLVDLRLFGPQVYKFERNFLILNAYFAQKKR